MAGITAGITAAGITVGIMVGGIMAAGMVTAGMAAGVMAAGVMAGMAVAGGMAAPADGFTAPTAGTGLGSAGECSPKKELADIDARARVYPRAPLQMTTYKGGQ